MAPKSYLWGVRICTFLSLLAFIFVIYAIDPEIAGVSGKIIFYSILFFFLGGIFILTLTWMRARPEKDELTFSELGISFREGILLSILVVALLVLQSFRILVWWDGLLVVAGIFLIELYFLTK